MTDFYRTERFKVDHSTFGGIVSDYDFGRHITMIEMISRIISDSNFDEQCKRNAKNRNWTK